MKTRREVIRTSADQYKRAKSRNEKSVILDNAVKVLGCHRKHAIRALANPPALTPTQSKRHRPLAYQEVMPVIERVNASGLEQSFKIYDCENCSNCPFKPSCTKAKGNRQVHWNTIWKELKAKAKEALEDDEKSAIYTRRKVEVESVFGHIKGNRSFRRFS
ncbi:transposase [Paenibacillus barengoltzii]|jgi:hypothetical protein|uniref:transposase n=1 Tax=Paenibacillus barengoltzii TaxID=343517 RepID=UPI003F88FBC5